MGGKGGGTTTQKTVQDPWKPTQPFLKSLIGDTENLYQQGGMDFQPWSGIRVSPQSAMTQQSLQGVYDTATQGNPITGQAQQGFSEMMDPTGFGGMDAVKQSAMGDIMPGAMSRFAGSGMLDSTLAADAAGRAATQAIAPIEYGAWENAQNRKLGALGMAPELSANAYLDSQMLGMAGGQQDQYMQSLIDAARGSFSEEQSRQYDELQRAAGMGLGFGGTGGTGSTKEKGGSGGGGVLGAVGDIAQVALPLMRMANI